MMSLRNLCILYLIILLTVMWFDVDRHLTAFLFQLEGAQWSLKHAWLTQTVLHDVAHDMAISLYIVILLSYVASFVINKLKSYRFGLGYLAISMPLATLSVSALKRLTQVDCPWSVVDFGGSRSYQFWMESVFSPLPEADHCFPAGHASSAYMFFALYFCCRFYWPKYALGVLLSVILAGLTFGIAQQLRGAHFLSHDLTSAFICWSITSLCWQAALRYGSRSTLITES